MKAIRIPLLTKPPFNGDLRKRLRRYNCLDGAGMIDST